MPLFHIQDDDRPAWVVASNLNDALKKWTRAVEKENDEEEAPFEVDPPQGVQFVCDNSDLIIGEGFFLG